MSAKTLVAYFSASGVTAGVAKEIARAMGLKPSTVQTRLARARERLKKMLTEE